MGTELGALCRQAQARRALSLGGRRIELQVALDLRQVRHTFVGVCTGLGVDISLTSSRTDRTVGTVRENRERNHRIAAERREACEAHRTGRVLEFC